MSFNISYVYQAIDKFTPIANKIAKSIDGIKDKIKLSTVQMNEFSKSLNTGSTMASKFKRGLDGATLSAQKLGSALRLNNAIAAGGLIPPSIIPPGGGAGGGAERMAFGAAMMSGGKKIKSAGMAMTPMSAGIDILGISSIKAAAQMQTMQIGFDAMLGSAAKGKVLMEEMKDLTVHTPFLIPDIADSARRLLSANIKVEDISKNIKFLGDIASGANKPLDQMVYIFAKVHNQGKAMGREFMMMSNMGINLRKNLVDNLLENGKHIDLKRVNQLISKGLITPEIFDRMLHTYTDKGGMYFNMMQQKMNSLDGAWSNFLHYGFLARSIVGWRIAEILDLQHKIEDLSIWMLKVAENFDKWAVANPILAKIAVYFGLFLGVLAPVLIVVGLMATGLGALVTGIGFVIGVVWSLTTGFTLLSIAMLSCPLVWMVGILAAVGVGIAMLIDYLEDLYDKFFNTNPKIPTWMQTIIDAKNATGGLTFENNQLSGVGMTATNGLFQNNSKNTVDVNINLEPVAGFKATAKGSVTGLGAGDLGMNMMGGY